MKRSAISAALIAASISFAVAAPPDHWEQRPELTPARLVKEDKGVIFSTDAMAWSGGTLPLFILYIKVEDRIYRCLDFMTMGFAPSSSQCAELVVKGK